MPVKSPVPPRESLQHFALSPELKIELAACEPQFVDPVAVRFDEHGRMWVVEMRDYPIGAAGRNPSKSRISLLTDRDGDGFYETSSVFADGLDFATGVQPWRGGVFVTMAGEVAYMRDADDDGHADVRETWYSGFAEENTQLRANHPRLALDNHVYVANGLRGGKIVNHRKPGSKPLDISGMDFRFDPLTGECEAVSGVGQFGMTFDDFGNRFVCTNRNPAIHVVLENRYLKKNPLVAVPTVTQDIARAAEQSRVFPITEAWTTSNLHAGQFTAACGVEIYRGDALPAEYYGNIFTCEPTGHLVHREVMRPNGVTFESTPAEQGKDFLASRDAWFSPVNLEVGPDGALYVVDMYRAVIEHPDWMPAELQHRPDQLLGNDRGRIYRVLNCDARVSKAAFVLASKSSPELVTELKAANAWRRETASRLLLERQDKAILPQLSKLALSDETAAGRIAALRLLEALNGLTEDLVRRLLTDQEPRVIEHAVYASELAARGELIDAGPQLVLHLDPRVRFAALLALAPHPIVPRQPADEWEQQALLIAAGNKGSSVLLQLLANRAKLEANVHEPKSLVAAMARLAGATDEREEHQKAISALLASEGYCQAGLASFLAERLRHGDTLDAVFAKAGSARTQLDHAFHTAKSVAQDAAQPEEVRREALDLLALDPESAPLIASMAADDPSQTLRLHAIGALSKLNVSEPWRQLLEGFAADTPPLQRAILDGLLARADRTTLLLDEIAAGQFKSAAIDAAHTSQLLNHRDAATRRRAEALLASAVPADRQQALDDFRIALEMQGNVAHGREIFAKHCATCHKIGDIGANFAPDISDSRERTPLQLLTDILQPNRAVDSNYFSYTALTHEGLAVTGILATETSTSITLKENAEKETTLPRDHVEQLVSNGVSLMPEGLEREITHQEMADLIAFIKNWRYPAGTAFPSAK